MDEGERERIRRRERARETSMCGERGRERCGCVQREWGEKEREGCVQRVR